MSVHRHVNIYEYSLGRLSHNFNTPAVSVSFYTMAVSLRLQLPLWISSVAKGYLMDVNSVVIYWCTGKDP